MDDIEVQGCPAPHARGWENRGNGGWIEHPHRVRNPSA
jgi:hypothetical protein